MYLRKLPACELLSPLYQLPPLASSTPWPIRRLYHFHVAITVNMLFTFPISPGVRRHELL